MAAPLDELLLEVPDELLLEVPDELLLEELLLEELLLEELLLEVPDELLELLRALPEPLPPQALRASTVTSGNTRQRLGNVRMLDARYWSSVTSTPSGTRLGT